MSLISLVTSSDSNFRNAIGESLDLLKLRFGSNLRNITIKPDVCYYWDHSTGQTTNPNLVGDLIDLLRERTSLPSKVSIVASDAPAGQCKHLFEFLGYEKLAREKNVNLVNLSEDRLADVTVNVASHFYTVPFPSIMRNADLFINVPKMKLWPGTKISCALQNIYDHGLSPEKLDNCSSLDELIVAASKTMRPNLCIVDGVMVRGKHTKKLGLIMSSDDPVAVDAAAAGIMGLNPKSVDHIVLAEKEGIGTLAYNTVGERISQFAEAFPQRSSRDKIWAMISSAGFGALKKLGRNA